MQLNRSLNEVGKQTLELFLPSSCRLCDQSVSVGADFCSDCEAKLTESEARMESACRRCGRPGGQGNQRETERNSECKSDGQFAPPTSCRLCKNETHHFDQCVALWTYQGLVCDAIVGSKFGSRIALADAIARRLADRIQSSEVLGEDSPDIVTSVPSHLWRRIRRGWGGSRVIAEVVVNELSRKQATLGQVAPGPAALGQADLAFDRPSNRPVFRELLATTRQIQKQALLGEGDRESNVAGAFRIRGLSFPIPSPIRRRLPIQCRHQKSLAETHVMLIDDVMTTGATANEIAKVLKSVGVRRVTVAVVARACAE